MSEEQSQAIDHIKYIQNHMMLIPALQYYFGDLKGVNGQKKNLLR